MQTGVGVRTKETAVTDSRRSQNQIVKLEMIEVGLALALSIHQMATEIRKKDECSLLKNFLIIVRLAYSLKLIAYSWGEAPYSATN